MTSWLRSSSSSVWIAAGAVFSGLSTYGLLVLTARAVGPTGYSEFSLFWSAVVIASLGLFLPVEQASARRAAHEVHAGRSSESIVRAALRAGAVLAVGATAVHATLWLLRADRTAADFPWVAPAVFVLAAGGLALQAAARGVLAGHHRLRPYAVVVVLDAGVRGVAAGALWLAGVSAVAPYVLAVGSAALLAGVVGVGLVRRERPEDVTAVVTAPGGLRRPEGARELRRPVVAAVCMQSLLNSGMIVAALAAAGDPPLAGRLLAIITLARIPVFLLQAGQAAYVGRIAAAAAAHDQHSLRRIVGRLATLVGTGAAGTLLVAAVPGPAIVRWAFGPGYDVTWGTAALVAGGVAAYLMASLSNDLVVALGAYARTAPAWAVGTVAGALVALLVPNLVLRSALPLLVGSLVAGAVLIPVVVSRLRETRVRA